MRYVALFILASSLASSLLLGGCEGAPGPTVVQEDPTDLPMDGLGADELARFMRGDVAIERAFRDMDGLGPLYIEASCRTCHRKDQRGPGKVERMSIASPDGTAALDQSALPFGSVVRRHLTAGATQPIVPPSAAPGLELSARFGPALFARGRMEAISDEDLLAEEARQAAAGQVSGRANVLADGRVGRFGVKARLSTLDVFTADALHGDMGLTTPVFPNELPNPEGIVDDLKPGVDVDAEFVSDVAFYIRVLAMPRREGLAEGGAQLFSDAGCRACHVSSYRTRADHSVAALADIPADLYSDLLLHDMGAGLADAITDVHATGREWKTAPLVGLRFVKTYLHDGRAPDLKSAIEMHAGPGSEANDAVARFLALSSSERDALLQHLQRL